MSKTWYKGQGLIFACLAGSHMYGTNRPDSDIDIRGVCFNPINSLLGLTGFEQYQPGKEEAKEYSESSFNVKSDDVTIYGLNKFCVLAMNANPNIIELLFAPVLYCDDTWGSLLGIKEAFLSTKIIHTFAGYAYSQLQRIRLHKEWLDNPPIKPNPYEYGMINNGKGGQDWTSSNLKNAYGNLLKKHQDYENWRKNRNLARAGLEERYGYDTKHAAHLYRLVLEAEDLLLTGKLQLPLSSNSRAIVRAALTGAYKYEEIVELGELAKDRLLSLESKSILPKKPDIQRIENWLIHTNYKWINA